MKKQLNVDRIQSELRGGSAFFPGYKREGSPTDADKKPQPDASSLPANDTQSQAKAPASVDKPAQGVPPGVPQPVPRGVPPSVRLIPKKARRPIRQRQPFDIYEDQYQVLKKIAAAEKGFENGRSMGQMVRDAIDAYLRDHNAS
jgi:hypothetical protein